jgi:uncharacterized protein with von Willebrand factor type A (vWA) domain
MRSILTNADGQGLGVDKPMKKLTPENEEMLRRGMKAVSAIDPDQNEPLKTLFALLFGAASFAHYRIDKGDKNINRKMFLDGAQVAWRICSEAQMRGKVIKGGK